MPDRFQAFSDDQVAALIHEFDVMWRRTVSVLVMLAIGVAIGYAVGLYQIQRASDRSDAAAKLAIQINRHLIQDTNRRAAESRLQAAVSAKAAYAACRRQQETVILQREFYHLILPHNVAGRTLAQQVAVADFYAQLRAHHILTIPVCQKPPKGS